MQGQCQGWHRSGHNVTPAQEGAVRQLPETDGQSALWILRMHNTQATSQDLAQPLQSSLHPTSWGPLSSAWALVDSKSCPGLEGLWLLRPEATVWVWPSHMSSLATFLICYKRGLVSLPVKIPVNDRQTFPSLLFYCLVLMHVKKLLFSRAWVIFIVIAGLGPGCS